MLASSALVLLGRADEDDRSTQIRFRADRFQMVRVQYDSVGGRGEAWYAYEGRIWQRWETDFPRAELNFLYRLSELTSLVVDPEPISLKLTDRRLFDHPFLFMSDVGWQALSVEELSILGQYLKRGGFLWIDDFWGQAEWENLAQQTRRSYPEWQWQEIPSGHPILRAVYPLETCPQVPARLFYESTGLPYDPPWIHRQPNGGDADLSQVHFRGLFDDAGRLLAVATHNTDIADGWEREGEDQDYFERFSVATYALGINILFYALTH